MENKIGIADDKVVEELNKLDLNKISTKKLVIELSIDQMKHLIIINALKIRNNKTITFN